MLVLAFMPNVGMAELIVVAVVAVMALPFYLLPTFIALGRRHQNTPAIVALDLLLGWTFLGWVAALVWSLTVVEKARSKQSAE